MKGSSTDVWSQHPSFSVPMGAEWLIINCFSSQRNGGDCFSSPCLPGLFSFLCWTKWQILLWNLMTFEIEFQATIILSTQAVTGMMMPSRPNYSCRDTWNCSGPQGVVESRSPSAPPLWPTQINFNFWKYLEDREAKPVSLTLVLITLIPQDVKIDHCWFGVATNNYFNYFI